jgi:DNA-binding NtrC family response regulator
MDFVQKTKEILFIPPPEDAVANVEAHFRDQGLRFSWVEGHQELFHRLKAARPFMVIFDLARCDGSICSTLPQLTETLTDCKTIIFGREVDIQTLEMLRLTEIAFLPTFLEASALKALLENILRDGSRFFARNGLWSNPYCLLCCCCPGLNKVKTIIDEVAPTDIPLLIEGERGTGKELVAKAVHFRSPRSDRPFVKVNCAGIPGELLESELFGFDSETPKGTDTSKPGKLELANEGTIFFDGIGEIEDSLQAKLVQVLQEKEFSRLGGEKPVPINCRMIAASERDLGQAVQKGGFREDLYHRLSVVLISLLPLRDRKEEIPLLIQHFLNFYNTRYGRSYPGISKETEGWLMGYDWPGNVRQLENTIKRIVVSNDESWVVQELLAGQGGPGKSMPSGAPFLQPLIEEGDDLKEVGRRAARKAEKEAIRQVLQETRWNRREASELLRISYKALLYKIKEYALDQ